MANFFDWLDAKKILFSRTPGGQTLISEDVDLAGSDIQRLPDELLVGGHLILRNTPLAILPIGLNVLEDLDLRNTSITALPPDLSVGGGLFLENTRIVSLPENFRIEDSLVLENSLIASLPRNLWVGGYLNLRGTAISSLPEDWYVEGPLLLDVENIASPLAWRYIKLADLNADDHLMGDYCLDTSSVGDFFDKADDEVVEIFAVWVSGEIRVYAGRHYGIPQKFMGDDTSDTFQQIIRDCVAELEERLSTDWH
ncbi:hypothetical protein [Candidatus Sodalis sp. SoCistrobi]|uniref:hypothetical protein n=1 Tax=Candidatus Sodalis sp. SoCistrobi TaxID=1922216 RepID=UPI00093E52E8|nr:hypothetical protein [Candidatus Sodalis sp. SoCistrobi]